ncbi:hypothetical protein BaRGS_00036917, partial [Batillaria attramentaria]
LTGPLQYSALGVLEEVRTLMKKTSVPLMIDIHFTLQLHYRKCLTTADDQVAVRRNATFYDVLRHSADYTASLSYWLFQCMDNNGSNTYMICTELSSSPTFQSMDVMMKVSRHWAQPTHHQQGTDS